MPRTVQSELKRINTSFLIAAVIFWVMAAAIAVIPAVIMGGFTEDLKWFMVTAAFPAAAGAGFYMRMLYLRKDPERHSFMKKIKSIGFAAETVIDSDLLQAKDYFSLTIGRTWLINRGSFENDLIAVSDIVWLYETTGHMEYASYSILIIKIRNGRQIQVNLFDYKKISEALFAELTKNAPWAITGDSPALQKLWKKDRADFISQVDRRRSVIMGAG